MSEIRRDIENSEFEPDEIAKVLPEIRAVLPEFSIYQAVDSLSGYRNKSVGISGDLCDKALSLAMEGIKAGNGLNPVSVGGEVARIGLPASAKEHEEDDNKNPKRLVELINEALAESSSSTAYILKEVSKSLR